MFLRYGNYSHGVGECSVVIQKEGIFSACGQPDGVRERWNIQGCLHANDQAGITTAIRNLQLAYDHQKKDIALYIGSGTLTSHSMNSSTLRGGTRVVVPPSFPEGRGAEYSTFRNYTIVVEGIRPDNNVGLLTWGETFNWTGTGGVVWGYLQGVSGEPEQQRFQQLSTAMLVQSGQAVGHLVYPAVSPPIMPGPAEHENRRKITQVLAPDNSERRRVTWSYTFETLLPITGSPLVKSINR